MRQCTRSLNVFPPFFVVPNPYAVIFSVKYKGEFESLCPHVGHCIAMLFLYSDLFSIFCLCIFYIYLCIYLPLLLSFYSSIHPSFFYIAFLELVSYVVKIHEEIIQISLFVFNNVQIYLERMSVSK